MTARRIVGIGAAAVTAFAVAAVVAGHHYQPATPAVRLVPIIAPAPDLPKPGHWKPASAPPAIPLPKGDTLPSISLDARLHQAVATKAPAAPSAATLGHCVSNTWRERVRDVASLLAIPSAKADDPCICPAATSDLSGLAQAVKVVGGITSVVSFASKASGLLGGTHGALGDAGAGQAGTPAVMLDVPPPDLSTVTAIPGMPVPERNWSTQDTAAAWIGQTFATANTSGAALESAEKRRQAALIAAAQYGYGLASQQQADLPNADAEIAATANLGNAGTAIGQAGALGTTAATLAADAQHWAAEEEAALEIEATEAQASEKPQIIGGGTQ
ncbi:MAG: hypothetical protein M0006_15415 [Magnetospirillum sp.]|nr:hypothetical protein [Magnetospirillum sp.]